MFPPHVPKRVAKGEGLLEKGECDEPAGYFEHVLPRVRARYGDTYPIVEVMQYPGETIYVPGGWWHAVLNMTDTIAVTQNFASPANFRHVWRRARTGRRKMAVKVRARACVSALSRPFASPSLSVSGWPPFESATRVWLRRRRH